MDDERGDHPGKRPRRSGPDGRSGDKGPYRGGKGPYRGGTRGGKPYRGKPYQGKPGGKPYQGKPSGKPYQGKPGGPVRGGGGDTGPTTRDEGGGRRGEERGSTQGSVPQHRHQPGRRHVEYGHRDRPRGPRQQRGPWDRDEGRRQQRPDRGPRGRYPVRQSPPGPPPVELLGEDEEIVAGRRPVEEAFAARRAAKRLLVVPERRAALDQIVLHATTLRIPVVEVEGGTITAVSGFDGHQGVALVVAPREWATLDEVLALAGSRGEPPFLLALDHLEDPQNVGTLLRSAEACGVHGVIFPTKGAAPISPAAIKTSAGAVEHLLLVPMPDLAAGLVDLHARGVRVIGADGDAALTVREADLRGPIVVVTGSEGRGLNARVRKRVDLMARIPMRGKVASLNASVAGSVFLFEAAAQRDLPDPGPPPDEATTEPDPQASGAGQMTAEPELAPADAPAPVAEESPGLTDETDADPAPGPDDLLPEAPPPSSPEGPAR